MKKLKELRDVSEAEKTKGVVFSFGRFNPPTTGHEKLIKAADTIARTQGDDLIIFPSQSEDPKKNPLSFTDKVKFMRKMFRKYASSISGDKGVKTAFDAVTKLYDMGYREVTMIVGADRIKEFDTLLNKYNGIKGRHGFYDFPNGIQIKSAGNRADPDSDAAKTMSADAMSASVLRKLAADGDFDTFILGVPDTLGMTDKRVLFNKIRTGMKLAAINEMFELLFDDTLLNEEQELVCEKAPPDADIEKWLEKDSTKAEFKKRYGDKWQEVMYATAWKMHKDKQAEEWNVDEELDEDWTEADLDALFEETFSDLTKKSFDLVREALKEEVKITPQILKDIEKYADKLFAKLGIDVEFTRHFLDRVNDERNKKQITSAELIRLFKQTHRQYGKKIAQMGPDAQAVINDMMTDINMPFVLKWDDRNQELDLVAKTVMRKKNFGTSNPKLQVQSYQPDPIVAEGVSVHVAGNITKQQTKIEKEVKTYGGEYDGMTDKGVNFKFSDQRKADAFKAAIKRVTKDVFTEEEDEDENPCWKGYKMVGMKKGKDGKEVPNCVPESEVKQGKELNELTSNALPQIDDVDGDGIPDDPYFNQQTRLVPFEVKIEGFPSFILWSVSISKVRSAIRMTLKRLDDIEYIERITDVEARAVHKRRYDQFNRNPLRTRETGKKIGDTDIDQAYLSRQDAYYRESYEYGTDELVDAYKKATPGEIEEAPMWLKDLMGSSVQKGKYEKAAQALLKYVDKQKDAKKHSLEYWASEIIRMTSSKLDARILAKTAKKVMATEAIFYAKENGKSLHEIYRPHSEMYYELFETARELGAQVKGTDKYLLEETDLGEWNRYEGKMVPLDIPLVEEADVELNSPKRGGSKKFYVYVKNDKGNVVKVQFGDDTGLQAKINDKEATKSFVARHDCANKKDKTTPGYWSCRLPMYAKELGLEGGGDYFW